ncbi:MAG: ATP-binding cassette domain-containing protein [Desulforhopalus sp.]|nr:ATP-binding cassette domain-containing protein [Desulforhopalus sp.]
MIIEDFSHPGLRFNHFAARCGESWCIQGGNRSGAEVLLHLFSGDLEEYSVSRLELPEMGVLSFRRQQEMFEDELRNDDTDFMNKLDPGTLVREFLPDWEQHLPLLQALDLERCLDTGYRQLSSGQNRKLILLMEVLGGAEVLVLQNPYDGLDDGSRKVLDETLQTVVGEGRGVFIFVTARVDVPEWCSHLAVIEGGEMVTAGEMAAVRGALVAGEKVTGEAAPEFAGAAEDGEELISLVDGFAGYGGKNLFTGLNLTVRSGDHTLVTGHNGCGKSTLLDILTGDNPKCYSNELRIFGKNRGGGESIWEIKKQMGIVSPALHRSHHGVGTALHVVLSGLYDSIGLYTRVTRREHDTARRWLAWAGLGDVADIPFSQLSYGEQRLTLIARALVKGPKLLMLDEPTQGLDDDNRELLLQFLEKAAEEKLSTIFYISHRQDEFRPFFHQRIRLDEYEAGKK